MTRSLIPVLILLLSLAALPACSERKAAATTGRQEAAAASPGSDAQQATPSGTDSAQASPSEEGSPGESASPAAESPAAPESPSAPEASPSPTPTPSPTIPNSYDYQKDWNDPQHLIPLDYQQAQGKRIFYTNCVWCHADSTPAGPSNRSNVTPTPPLINDGQTFNQLSDEAIQNIITLGGSAMGKSAMMPPWGKTLSQNDIKAVITYIRAVAVPAYQPSARPKSQYSVK